MSEYQREIDLDSLWFTIQAEARLDATAQPLLAALLQRHILSQPDFAGALASLLAEKLMDPPTEQADWQRSFYQLIQDNPAIEAAALKDLLCQLRSNASIKDHYTPLLHFGGYQALQCHRLAHQYWTRGEQAMACYIQGRVVSLYGVDIHPNVPVGAGIFIDHAVGIVVGETCVIEDDVTLFQGVTLGGTGKGEGQRHPKIRKGAFIGSNAIILGNIDIGANAKVAAGAVVVKSVAPGATVVGQVARPFVARTASTD